MFKVYRTSLSVELIFLLLSESVDMLTLIGFEYSLYPVVISPGMYISSGILTFKLGL